MSSDSDSDSNPSDDNEDEVQDDEDEEEEEEDDGNFIMSYIIEIFIQLNCINIKILLIRRRK